jgi:hypothetical protein
VSLSLRRTFQDHTCTVQFARHTFLRTNLRTFSYLHGREVATTFWSRSNLFGEDNPVMGVRRR